MKVIGFRIDEFGNRSKKVFSGENVSELERCILSQLGRAGKNQGVPAQGDYQRMQFKVMDSIRHLKSTGANIVIMAWEQYEPYQDANGQTYTMAQPQINKKIINNVCGLCDCVGRLMLDGEGRRGFVLQPTNSVYAKNQIDMRLGCLQSELFNAKENEVVEEDTDV